MRVALHISGIGMVTAIGDDTHNTIVALAAGARRVRRAQLVDLAGERITGAFAFPVRAEHEGFARASVLAWPALVECLDELTPARGPTALIVCTLIPLSLATAFIYLHQRGIFRGWSAPALAAYVDHALDHAVDGRCQLKCPPQIEADIFGSLPQGLWPLLDKVAVPVDVLMGEQSYPFARKASSQWARRNARVRVHPVAGDHCYMQDAPDASAELLRALLSAGAASR